MGDMADILSKYTNLGSMSSYFIDWMGIASVKSYGAVGDNSTDDTAAIQECIDAVIAAGQKLVYLPHGIYLNTGLTDTASVTFLGDNSSFSGSTYTVIDWSALADTTSVLAITGVLASLNSTIKTNLVAAINSVLAELGNIASLTTTVKTSAVASINELHTDVGNLETNMGRQRTSFQRFMSGWRF